MIRIRKIRLLVLAVVLVSFIVFFRERFFQIVAANKSFSIDLTNKLPDHSIQNNSKMTNDDSYLNQIKPSSQIVLDTNEDYIINLNSLRINKLIKKLQQKEKDLVHVLKSLNLLSFSDLLAGNFKNFEELESYFDLKNGELHANEKFLNHLKEISYKNSFQRPRSHFNKTKIASV